MDTSKIYVSTEKVATYGEMIAEKFHGFSEKLLGHHRSDSDTSAARAKTGKHITSFRYNLALIGNLTFLSPVMTILSFGVSMYIFGLLRSI